MNYVNFSRKHFGWIVRIIRDYFKDMKSDLASSKMGLTLDEYLSVAVSTTLITFAFETIFLSMIFGFTFKNPVEAVIMAFTLSVALSGMLFLFFYVYPSSISKNREKDIDLTLPFSATYFYALSSGDVLPSQLFKTMSKFKDYGEVSKESEEISRNVEMFGMDILKSIKTVAESTPSKKLKEFLWGMYTTISSGGRLNEYLKDKSDELMDDYANRIEKFSQDLSVYIEIYFTMIIAGSIFFIVLSAVMGLISASPSIVMIQSFVIFILLPLISIMFIIFTKSVSPVQ